MALPKWAARRVRFWPLTAAAVQPAAALKMPVRTPEEEYEEEMRLPSAGGAGDRAHCYRCAGARRFCVENMTPCAVEKYHKDERHTTHPPVVPVVVRDAVGAVVGAQPTAPGRKGGSNPRRRRLPVHGAWQYTVHASCTLMRKNGSKLARVFTQGQCVVTRSGEVSRRLTLPGADPNGQAGLGDSAPYLGDAGAPGSLTNLHVHYQ